MSLHQKHRERLDKKVNEYGMEMLEPHEQLEYLLFAVIPRGDTNALAHRLLDRFITVGGVINASIDELMTIDGVGKSTARFLTSMPQLLGIVERSITVAEPPVLSDPEKIADFAKTYFYGRLKEAAYLFSLNSSYRLLAVTKISDGAQQETVVYTSQVVKQALNDNASAAIIAHNHPCGKVNPSASDIILTDKLFNCFNMVDIELFDSIIVSGNNYFSFRESGHITHDGVEQKIRSGKNGL